MLNFRMVLSALLSQTACTETRAIQSARGARVALHAMDDELKLQGPVSKKQFCSQNPGSELVINPLKPSDIIFFEHEEKSNSEKNPIFWPGRKARRI